LVLPEGELFVPIYEYVCQSCSHKYEALVLSSEAKVQCPQCGSERKSLQLSVFSSPKGGNGTSAKSASAPSCACTPTSCGCH
jgi:putative FmdB family regulatory protein